MFFIKFILDDEQQSMAAKILKLQTEQPTNGDQASMCRNDLKQMKRNQKNDKRKFQSNHQTKYWYFCLKYILKKINPKGKEFLYDRLEIQMIWIIECHKTKFRYHYFYLYTRLLVQILLQYLIFWQHLLKSKNPANWCPERIKSLAKRRCTHSQGQLVAPQKRTQKEKDCPS